MCVHIQTLTYIPWQLGVVFHAQPGKLWHYWYAIYNCINDVSQNGKWEKKPRQPSLCYQDLLDLFCFPSGLVRDRRSGSLANGVEQDAVCSFVCGAALPVNKSHGARRAFAIGRKGTFTPWPNPHTSSAHVSTSSEANDGTAEWNTAACTLLMGLTSEEDVPKWADKGALSTTWRFSHGADI